MDEEPQVSVIRGTPTPEELAALTVVLTTRTTNEVSHSGPPELSAWARSARPAAGRTTWRASAHPTRT
ncbi:acyl-CoA carboxylase epsilon subunit [Actinoplanes friuliensis]|uniref:acyl-CoA carboxylase epsilon subunit n=1 Tax=Actinoplanes friuliensis TaxID=196914 RepID=UPI0009FDB89F|nr:acyl-CoA carboxylase epsilon subunit [Actinoplanes friuliensis]